MHPPTRTREWINHDQEKFEDFLKSFFGIFLWIPGPWASSRPSFKSAEVIYFMCLGLAGRHLPRGEAPHINAEKTARPSAVVVV